MSYVQCPLSQHSQWDSLTVPVGARSVIDIVSDHYEKIHLNFGMRLIVLSLKTQHLNAFIFIVYEKHVEVAFSNKEIFKPRFSVVQVTLFTPVSTMLLLHVTWFLPLLFYFSPYFVILCLRNDYILILYIIKINVFKNNRYHRLLVVSLFLA